MRVPLSDEGQHSGGLITFKVPDRLCGIGFFRGRYDGVQAVGFQDGVQHFEESHLRGNVEMASFLSSVGSPITRHRFVERRKRTELYAVFLFIMSAHVYQIMGECFIVFRFQVVGRRISITRTTSAVSHVVGTGIAEGLEYGIRTLLFDFQHDFTLCGITVPNVFTVRAVFEAFHFRTQAFSASHVVRRAVPVLRVVSPTDVVAENTVVQSVRAD